jgi:ATP-binding cassette, subfamily B, bacterial
MAAWIKRSPLLRCLAIYREIPVRFAITITLFLIVNGSFSWQQWLIGRAVNEVHHGLVVARLPEGGLDYHRAWFWLALLGGVALVRGVFQYAAGILALTIGQELLFIIRERILMQVQRLDLAYHWRHGIGEIVTRTTRDADKVRDALINFWRQVFETSLVILASVGILCWYSPWLGIVPLALTLLAISILTPQVDRLVALDRAVGAAYDAVNQDLTEGVHGVRVIKAFGLESLRIERFERQVETFAGEARGALAFAAQRIPLPQVIVAMSHVWVLAYGSFLIGQGRLHVGELVASLLVANTLVLRVEGIGSVMQIFADARSSAARIWDLLDAEPQIVSGRTSLPSGPLGLRFEHVRVAAPGGGNDILRDLSFEVRAGEIVALVGATGSGKSTLMGLLPRLVEADDGAVLLGAESDWQDLRDLDLGCLRERVHVVPQESFLFSDTLSANLRLGAPQASEDDLREALRLAAAEEILEARKEGFDTRLGDRGITLSGGQRQRLCLARALLSKPAVLGLDDATSALDAATERRVLENIRGFRHGSGQSITILVVSSRLSTILLADRVLLLADGKIAALGTHDELAETNTAYRDLMGL